MAVALSQSCFPKRGATDKHTLGSSSSKPKIMKFKMAAHKIRISVHKINH